MTKYTATASCLGKKSWTFLSDIFTIISLKKKENQKLRRVHNQYLYAEYICGNEWAHLTHKGVVYGLNGRATHTQIPPNKLGRTPAKLSLTSSPDY